LSLPPLELPTICNCARIRRASRVITRFYDSALAPAGLGINQFTLLGYLRTRGPMALNQLADLLAMDRATVGHNVRPLERDGLIELIQSREDGRVKLTALTEKGGEMLDAARPLWERAQAQFEQAIGTDTSEDIRAVMDKVAALRHDILAPVEPPTSATPVRGNRPN